MVNLERVEFKPLVSYLSENEVLSELVNWVFTKKYKLKANFEKIRRNAVQVLSSSCRPLLECASMNKTFIRSIHSALDSDMYKDLTICGHFQRIFENFLKFTSGKFLQYFPNLCSFLVDHVYILALRVLLIRICSDFKSVFSEEQYRDVALKIVHAVRGSHGYFAITAMRDIIKEQRDTKKYFQDKAIINTLLMLVTSQTTKVSNRLLFETETFQVIETLITDNPGVQDLIVKYDMQYRFDRKNITCASVAAFRVFKSGIDVLLDRLFENPPISILNDLIVKCLKDMPNEKLAQLIDKFKIPQKIIEQFEQNRFNGHITELAKILSQRESCSTILQTREWKLFVSGPLATREAQSQVENTEESDISAIPMGAPQIDELVPGVHISTSTAELKGMFGQGVKSMHSFTIPTVYQADLDLTPISC